MPTKAKANKSKLLIISIQSFCQDKSADKISCRKKIKYFPSFVCLLHGEHELAAVPKSCYNGANNPSPYPIFTTNVNEYIYIYTYTEIPEIPNSCKRTYSLSLTNHISACHASRHCSVFSNFV